MAIAYVASSSGQSSATNVVTTTLDPTSNDRRKLISGFVCELKSAANATAPDPNPHTFDGVAMTAIANAIGVERPTGTYGMYCSLSYMDDADLPAGGSAKTLSYTGTGTAAMFDDMVVAGIIYSDATQGALADADNNNAGSATSITTPTLTVSDNAMCVAAYGSSTNVNWTLGTGETSREELNPSGMDSNFTDKTASSDTTMTITASVSGRLVVAAGVILEDLGGGGDVTRVLNDSVTVIDAQTRAAINFRLLMESINVEDLIIPSQFFVKILSDSVDINDALTRGVFQFYAITLMDSIIVNDEIARYVNALRVLTNEVDVTDVIQRNVLALRKLEDSVDTNDLIIRKRVVTKLLQDSVTVDDALSRVVLFHRLLLENVDVNDDLLRFISASRVLNDALSIYDSITRTVIEGGIIQRILTDSIDINDTVERFTLLTRFINDEIAILDNLIRTTIGADHAKFILMKLAMKEIDFNLAKRNISMFLSERDIEDDLK